MKLYYLIFKIPSQKHLIQAQWADIGFFNSKLITGFVVVTLTDCSKLLTMFSVWILLNCIYLLYFKLSVLIIIFYKGLVFQSFLVTRFHILAV